MANPTALEAGEVATVQVSSTAVAIELDPSCVYDLTHTSLDSAGSATTALVYGRIESDTAADATAAIATGEGQILLPAGSSMVFGKGKKYLSLIVASGTAMVRITAGARLG